MLTAEGCAARRARLWGAVPADCDALIVGDPSHLVYFAGYAPSPFVFRTVESAALLLLEPGRATLVADNLLGPFLERAHADEVSSPSGTPASSSTPHRRALVVNAARWTGWPAARGAGSAWSWRASPPGVVEGLRAAWPGLEIVDIGPIIRPLRRSKDPDEVAVLRRVDPRPARPRTRRPWRGSAGDDRAATSTGSSSDGGDRGGLGEPAIVYGDFASGPRCETERGGPPTVADDRAGRPAAARLLGGRLGLSGRLHQHIRRRRRPDAPPARAVRCLRRRPRGGRRSI